MQNFGLILSLFLYAFPLFAQTVTYDENFQVESPESFIKVGNELSAKKRQYVFQRGDKTVLLIVFGTGFTGNAFELEIGESIQGTAFYYSCTFHEEFEEDQYWVTLNQKQYKVGDTLKGEIYYKAKESYGQKRGTTIINGSFIQVVDSTVIRTRGRK